MKVKQSLSGLFILLTVITVSCDNKSTSESDSKGDKSAESVVQNVSDDDSTKDMLKLMEKLKNDTLKAFLKDQQVLQDVEDFSDAPYRELDQVFFNFFSPQISKKGFRSGEYNDAVYEFSEEDYMNKVNNGGKGYYIYGIFYLNDNIFVILKNFLNPFVWYYAFMLDQEKEQFTQSLPVFVDADVYRANASVAGDTIIVNHAILDTFVGGDTSSFVNGKFVEKFLVKKDTLVLVQ